MRITINQPAGTQLFFDVIPTEQTTIRNIASLVEDSEGIPANIQLYSVGEEIWANHDETILSLAKNNQDELVLDVKYDLDGQGGVKCETASPKCACHLCCCEMRCIKKYDCFCCCCEGSCTIL